MLNTSDTFAPQRAPEHDQVQLPLRGTLGGTHESLSFAPSPKSAGCLCLQTGRVTTWFRLLQRKSDGLIAVCRYAVAVTQETHY